MTETLVDCEVGSRVGRVIDPPAGGAVLLELAYDYTPRGLIWQITETSPDPHGPAVVAFAYDNRGRLIEEQRVGPQPYHYTCTDDAGGTGGLLAMHRRSATMAA